MKPTFQTRAIKRTTDELPEDRDIKMRKIFAERAIEMEAEDKKTRMETEIRMREREEREREERRLAAERRRREEAIKDNETLNKENGEVKVYKKYESSARSHLYQMNYELFVRDIDMAIYARYLAHKLRLSSNMKSNIGHCKAIVVKIYLREHIIKAKELVGTPENDSKFLNMRLELRTFCETEYGLPQAAFKKSTGDILNKVLEEWKYTAPTSN